MLMQNMKLTTTILLALLAIFKIADATDTHDIESAFWSYTDAAVQSDGDKAAHIFSESGFDYWSKLIVRANTDQRSTILSLPTYQVFNILLIRERARSEKKLLSMTGEEWIKHS